MLGRKHLALMGLLLASNAGAYGGTIWFERADYPSSCSAACGPVLGAVDSCDALHKAKTARLECICDWTWASTQIPLCAACISKYGDEDDSEFVSYYHYNDDGDDSDDDENQALVLVNSCSLTTTTYNAAAATTLSYTVTNTAVSEASATATDSASSDATTSGDDSSSSTGTLSSSTVSTTTAAGEAAITLAPGILRTAALVGMAALL